MRFLVLANKWRDVMRSVWQLDRLFHFFRHAIVRYVDLSGHLPEMPNAPYSGLNK